MAEFTVSLDMEFHKGVKVRICTSKRDLKLPCRLPLEAHALNNQSLRYTCI